MNLVVLPLRVYDCSHEVLCHELSEYRVREPAHLEVVRLHVGAGGEEAEHGVHARPGGLAK